MPKLPKLNIIYEDNHLLVVEKPAGIPVQADSSKDIDMLTMLKEYRKVKYKEGYYESIVITIGEGKGDNWWCVLFPNLCLVDLENISDVEYKSWIEEKINKIF